MIRLLISTLLVGFCFFATAQDVGAQGTLNTETSAPKINAKINAAGRVMNSDGNPVAGVRVRIVGQRGWSFNPRKPAGSVQTITQTDGRFQTSWPETDRWFRQSPDLLVIADDGVDSLAVSKVPLRKFMAGLPLELKLADGASGSVRIVDSNGQPIQDAEVSAAKMGQYTLSYGVDAAETFGRSNLEGLVTFPGVRSVELTHVYVSSPVIGTQCLELTVDQDGQRIAVAKPTTKLWGSVSSTEDLVSGEPVDWSGLMVTLTTRQADDSSYVWSDTPVQSSGRFATGPLGDGELSILVEFPDSLPYALVPEQQFNFKRPDPGDPVDISLQRATAVTGKVIDSVDGSPLEGIYIQVTDSRPPVFSDSDGLFTFWHDQSRINYFPTDVWGRHVMGGAFFIYPQGLPEDHKLSIPSVAMEPASDAIGKVVDQDGEAVSGAIVRVEYKKERFSSSEEFYSGIDGEFRFAGITDGTGVSITAMTDTLMTDSSTSLTLASDSRPVLTVAPRHGLRVRGRLVDAKGEPIEKARVEVRVPTVIQKEFQSGLDNQVTAAFANAEPILTDADGRFVSPATLDWERKFSITASAARKRDLATYWRDGEPAGRSGGDLDLGDLVMLDSPESRVRSIRVVDDATGEPIESARAILLSSLHGRTAARSSSDGSLAIKATDGPCVLAIEAASYRPTIRPIDWGSDAVGEVRLVRPGSPMDTRVGASQDVTKQRSAAQALLKLAPPPFPTGTPHRQRLYAMAMAFADFDAAVATVKMLGGKDAENNAGLGDGLVNMSWLTPAQIESAMSLADEKMQFYLRSQQAERSNDVDKKLEYLGEAIVISRARTGADRLYAIGAIVDQLLALGEVELSKELIIEGWQSNPELAAVLESGTRKKERKPMTGEARVFAPLYALIDFDAAMDFLTFAATMGEIESLQAKAMTYVAAVDADAWSAIAKRRGIKEISGEGLSWFRGGIPFANFDDAVATMAWIEPANAKIEPLLDLAESNLMKADGSQPSDAQRAAVIAEVLAICNSKDEGYSDPPISSLAARAAKLVSPWDTELAEQLLFAAFWTCEGDTTILPMNTEMLLAAELAELDVSLAEALVRPCFDDWSWLLGDRDRDVIFTGNRPLAAAAAIDPAWAVELATRLSESHFVDEPSRIYETLYSIIQQWSDR